MPTTIAIPFLQTSTFAAVDRSTSCQGPKVTRHGLLMMVHAIRSRPIVTMRFRGITVVDNLPRAVVHVAAMFSRQTAVEILRRVNRLAQGFIVPAIIASICISLRGKRGADVVTSFRTATQMFSQPLSYATTSAASSMVVLNTVRIAGLASVIERTKQYCLQLLYKFKPRSITFFSKHTLSSHAHS